MIDHLLLTVSNLAASREFYRKALAPLGYSASPEFTLSSTQAQGVGFGEEGSLEFFIAQGLVVVTPIHLAFRVVTREKVKEFYQAALAAGGRDNGAPELTPEYHADYFSAYVLDPDVRNVEVVCH